ncbi:hypothetical protein BD310DRAFT_929106 [Dichomitus squalens]|uniref:Uncharacterized protein n=1 Tax=Dichomitus squalens TaxID=114155 RepID=A0A4Q9PT62_9APHY|nr:hypothetical protein BD310DRAFT_929106 [Dichomitus squalens]
MSTRSQLAVALFRALGNVEKELVGEAKETFGLVEEERWVDVGWQTTRKESSGPVEEEWDVTWKGGDGRRTGEKKPSPRVKDGPDWAGSVPCCTAEEAWRAEVHKFARQFCGLQPLLLHYSNFHRMCTKRPSYVRAETELHLSRKRSSFLLHP